MLALWLAAGLAPAAAGSDPWVDTLQGEIDPQQAYGSAADEISLSAAVELLLQLTNSTRLEAGLAELEQMELASRTAQAHAIDMVELQLPSHFSQEGYTCELRFNLAGGTDHIQENTAYYEIQHSVYLTTQLVERIHGHWMSSDSHRRNILDPQHTHLGAGFCVLREEGLTYVAGVAEFVNDYGDCSSLPNVARPGDKLPLRGWLDRERVGLRFIGIGIGELPKPPAVAAGRLTAAGYSSPPVMLALVPRYIPSNPRDIEFVRRVVDYDSPSGEFEAVIELGRNWPPGAYYVTVWADRQGAAGWQSAYQAAKPICVMTQVVLIE